MKKKRKWKVLGFSFLAIVVLGLGAFGYEYYQLQPKNHFKSVPVVASSNTKTTDKSAATQQAKPSTMEFNLLLIGSDQRKSEKIGHSDSMVLIHADLNKHEYHAFSIPRDTRVHLDGYGYTKLTSVQYIIQATKGQKQGIEAAVKAVSDLTGAPINYYVETNYTGFQDMVEAMGGIDMYVPCDVTLTAPWHKKNKGKVIKKGTHFLSGEMVAEVVHERHSLKNGDAGRQQMQEEALKGIAKKALSPSNIGNLPDLVKSIPKFVIGSNMSTSDMLSLGLAAKDFDPDKQLTYHQIAGKGEIMYDDILKANNYQLVIDDKKVKEMVAANF